MTKYRVYADGSVVHEDDFSEWDHSTPYYDDYATYEVPEEIEDHLTSIGEDDTKVVNYWVGSNHQIPEKIYFNQKEAMSGCHTYLYTFNKDGEFVKDYKREGYTYKHNPFQGW